jgi:hypothetical protein
LRPESAHPCASARFRSRGRRDFRGRGSSRRPSRLRETQSTTAWIARTHFRKFSAIIDWCLAPHIDSPSTRPESRNCSQSP